MYLIFINKMSFKYIKYRDSSFTRCKNNLKNIYLKNNSIEFIHIDIIEKYEFSIKTKININNKIKIFDISLEHNTKNITPDPTSNDIDINNNINENTKNKKIYEKKVLQEQFSSTNNDVLENDFSIETCTPTFDEIFLSLIIPSCFDVKKDYLLKIDVHKNMEFCHDLSKNVCIHL